MNNVRANVLSFRWEYIRLIPRLNNYREGDKILCICYVRKVHLSQWLKRRVDAEGLNGWAALSTLYEAF